MLWFDIILHGLQTFFAFIVLCCAGSLAHFQQKWHIGISGLSGFLLITSLLLVFLPLTMLLPPLLTKRYDTLERFTTLLKDPRVRWVLAGSGAGIAGIDAISISASVFSQSGCKDPSRDPHESLGDSFRDALKGWCTTKKAAAVFLWLLFLTWLVLLGKIGWDTYHRRPTHRTPYRTREYAQSQRTASDSGKDDARLTDPGTDGMPLMHSAEMGSFDARYGGEGTRKSGWWNHTSLRYDEEQDVTDNRYASPPRTLHTSPPSLGHPRSTTIHLGPSVPISSTPILTPSPRPRLPSHSFSRTPVSPPAAPVGISRTMILAASGNTDDPYARSRHAMGYGQGM